MTTQTTFHIPTLPYSPIVALNRRAAAVGSPSYARGSEHANYNGHHVRVWWNSYRRYYIAEYFFGGRRVLARGDFERCLDAAVREYKRALGSSVSITLRDDDAEAAAVCEAHELVKPEREPPAEWRTWRHDAAVESVRDYAHPGAMVRLFDWQVMQATETLEEYETAMRDKHGRVWV